MENHNQTDFGTVFAGFTLVLLTLIGALISAKLAYHADDEYSRPDRDLIVGAARIPYSKPLDCMMLTAGSIPNDAMLSCRLTNGGHRIALQGLGQGTPLENAVNEYRRYVDDFGD